MGTRKWLAIRRMTKTAKGMMMAMRIQPGLCGGLVGCGGGLLGCCGEEELARRRCFLDMVGIFLHGFSRESDRSDRGSGFLSGKRKCWVDLLLVRFVTRIGKGGGKIN
jgi:hypothetical protein